MPGWPCRAGMPRWQTCEDFPYVFKRRPSGPPRGQLRRAGLAPCRFAPGASRRRMRGVDGQTAASEVLTRRTEGQALTALLTYVPVLAAPSRLQLGRRTIMPPAGSASAPTTRDGLRRPGLPALDPGAPGRGPPLAGFPPHTGGSQTAPTWSRSSRGALHLDQADVAQPGDACATGSRASTVDAARCRDGSRVVGRDGGCPIR
jgi:hypothetical protein